MSPWLVCRVAFMGQSSHDAPQGRMLGHVRARQVVAQTEATARRIVVNTGREPMQLSHQRETETGCRSWTS